MAGLAVVALFKINLMFKLYSFIDLLLISLSLSSLTMITSQCSHEKECSKIVTINEVNGHVYETTKHLRTCKVDFTDGYAIFNIPTSMSTIPDSRYYKHFNLSTNLKVILPDPLEIDEHNMLLRDGFRLETYTNEDGSQPIEVYTGMISISDNLIQLTEVKFKHPNTKDTVLVNMYLYTD